MRVKTCYRALRLLSAVVLFFFVWTFGPIWQAVAFAAENHKASGVKNDGTTRAADPRTSGEKFEKALDDIRQKLRWAEDKSREGVEPTPEIEAIKSRKAEIESIDAELKAYFGATERKLKDAHLPQEILERHYKFVKHYQDNLKELVANLTQVERAGTKVGLVAAVKKTREHLDTANPPKKRKPFDPNKLPNRIVKAKGRQPKLKKEEWEKELKKEPKKTKAAQGQQQKLIIVASNGPLTGLLSGTDSIFVPNQPESYLQLANQTTNGTFQTAAAATWGKYPYPEETYPLPWETDMTPDDKIETPETHITDTIRAKAAELQNNPILMFNWLYNNIYLVPSYGSIQGADMCLQTKQCNATDIASLTIAMFRAADWPARYEFVTAELAIDKFMENIGGFTDPQAAITFAASGGIPVRPIISGGKITAVQFEHVYATALLPMGYYIGAVMKRGWSQPMWMPLDVTLKSYVTTTGIDINAAVPFDAQAFANQIQSMASINEAEGYVTNVNSSLIQQTMQDYQARVQDYISQNMPTATVGDVLGKREIKQINYPILSPTGRAKIVAGRVQSHTLPDSMISSISFNIPDPSDATDGLNYATSLSQIVGKKVTLSFSPATDADQKVIESYLPKPHTDGTSIQLSELPSSFPAYLINLKGEFRVDGQVVATGFPATMGQELSFMISLNEPGIGPSQINNVVLAGEYYGIGVDTGAMSSINALKAKLEATKTKLEAQNIDNLSKDDIVGDLLYTTIASYFTELDINNEITARLMNIVRYIAPSIGVTSLKLDVKGIFNIPISAGSTGIMMDVDRIMQAVSSKDGNMNVVKQYMLSSGMHSSILEHTVPERLYSQPNAPVNAISAAKALKLANDQGIPIYTVNQSNISSVLPMLQIGVEVKSDLTNAVNAGKTVIIPKSSIVDNGWTGYGYIIIDPVTGAGAYMISNGSSGAWIILGLIAGTLALFGIALITGWFFVCAGVIAALIGAILVGLAIGLVLSQLLSQDAKTQLKQLFTSMLDKAIPMLAAIGFPIAMAVAFIAWIIMKIMALVDLIAMNINRSRKIFYYTNVQSQAMEA